MDFTNCTGSPEQVLTQFFVFSFVRNPYTRILSAYMDKMVRDVPERTRLLPTLGFDPDKPPPPFIDFLKAVQSQRDDWRDIHWTTQSRLLQSNNISYSYIGRFETFATTFPKVLERIGIPPKFHDPSYVPHHATRANDRVAQYIGPKEREVIGAIYYADFNNFAYGFDPAVASI